MSLALGAAGCVGGDRARFPASSYDKLPNGEIALTKPVSVNGYPLLPAGTGVATNLDIPRPADEDHAIEAMQPILVFGSLALPVGTHVTFTVDNRLSKIVSPQELNVDGMTFPGGSELKFYPDGEYFTKDLLLSVVTLGGDATYKGLGFEFKKGDRIAFSNFLDRFTIAATLIASTRTFDNETYPPLTTLWFMNGAVARSRLKPAETSPPRPLTPK